MQLIKVSASFWLIGLAVALLLLGFRSRMSLLDGYLGPVDEHLIPTKVPLKGPAYPPILAYSIFGSAGEANRMLRLLKSIYHPRNQYLLHLDSSSSIQERLELVLSIQSQKEFRAFANVHVVRKSNAINQTGVSSLAAVLHSVSLLLRINADWDWFTALTTSDYPLLTQDDILYALSSLPRHLNFIHYTNTSTDDTKEGQYSSDEIVVDSSIYNKKNSPIFSAGETRTVPNSFKMYRGSPWMVLSRSFTEHCVKGWDNLPRKLLMYFTNVAFPLESYFHTVVCNTPEFQNNTLNVDLRYILPNSRTAAGAMVNNSTILSLDDYGKIVSSPAAFARPFKEGDPLLEKIDRDILKRLSAGVVPGKWCIDGGTNKSSGSEHSNYCSIWDDIDSINHGDHGMLLSKAIGGAAKRLLLDQCQVTF